MDEQDKKLIELYLQDARKKKYIIAIVVITLALFIFGMAYLRKGNNNVSDNNNVENINSINETKETQSNENNKNNISNQEPKKENNNKNNEVEPPKQEQEQGQKENENKVEPQKEIKENNEVAKPQQEEKENKKTEETPKQNTSNTEEKGNKTTAQKPVNKDFLFTDGYTMDNVSQAAESYLKSSGYPGRCEPLKDGEGIYLGMRVTFD